MEKMQQIVNRFLGIPNTDTDPEIETVDNGYFSGNSKAIWFNNELVAYKRKNIIYIVCNISSRNCMVDLLNNFPNTIAKINNGNIMINRIEWDGKDVNLSYFYD